MSPKFSYRAYDQAGTAHKGEIDALDVNSAKAHLKEQGFVPIAIEPVARSSGNAGRTWRWRRAPRLDDLELFTAQLALLLRNGIKIDQALQSTRSGIKNPALKAIVTELNDTVRRGVALSTAMERYPAIFDSLYVSIVRIGEATGQLAVVAADLADNLHFRQTIAAKTRQALVYPSIIFTVCVLSIFFVFNFIVPKFAVIFSGMPTLPVYTQAILTLSRWARAYQWLLPLLIGVLVWGIIKYRRHAYLRRLKDLLMLKLPLARSLGQCLESLRFSAALAILLKSGVMIATALDYAVAAVGNELIRKRLARLKDDVRQGKRLSESIARTGFLDEIYLGLIEAGEQTGDLAAIFEEITARLRQKYEAEVSRLIVFIEPVMIVFMGLVVGSVVVAMLLSLVSINDIQF